MPQNVKPFNAGIYKVQLVREGPITPTTAIQGTEDVAKIALEMRTLDREHLVCFWMNSRHHLIGKETISIGTLTASLAHPREIFKGAVMAGAAGIILVHNHPSGDPSPSEDDVRLTQRVAQAGKILGIDLLDHFVVGMEDSYSFKKSGRL